jgi:hypothetical protein
MLSEPVVGNDPERQLRHACEELKRRLHSGDDCRAEYFFQTYPSLASCVDHALELIYTEFTARKQLGQSDDPVRWLERFPQWREQIQLRLLQGELLRDSSQVDPATVGRRRQQKKADEPQKQPAKGPSRNDKK